MLQARGVRKSAKPHETLQKFLQLDPNYPNLIMLKKLAKVLDEMAKNDELMAGIMAAANGMDEEGGSYGENAEGNREAFGDNDYQDGS